MTVRNDWTREEIAALFDLPFDELVYQAATVHRAHHAVGQIQLCTLLSIKTGGCPEDCGYCSQSVKADSGVEATKLMEVQQVLQKAAQAADAGSKRFCMGAAWRNPKDRDMPAIVEIVKSVRAMGMETCMTLGMLTPKQADMLAEAGLDYYNHNIDTSPERYNDIITTRTMQDRLDTLDHVRKAGINVCSGGIVGMGETRADRVGFIHTLATLPQHPERINQLDVAVALTERMEEPARIADPKARMETLQALAIIATRQKDFEKARVHYTAALGIVLPSRYQQPLYFGLAQAMRKPCRG